MRLMLKVIRRAIALIRKSFYRFISDACVEGRPVGLAPVLTLGDGKIRFSSEVTIGIMNDAGFWNTNAFLNVRTPESFITIGQGTMIGNRFTAISEGPGIEIGENTLIGTDVSVYDTDFHALPVDERLTGIPKKAKVVIGSSVWIGDRVLILKGSEIGEGSVVAAGAVVCGKFPAHSLIGGVPAKMIRMLSENLK